MTPQHAQALTLPVRIIGAHPMLGRLSTHTRFAQRAHYARVYPMVLPPELAARYEALERAITQAEKGRRL